MFLQCHLPFPLSSSSVSTVLFAISFILLFCFCNVLCHFLYPPLLFLQCHFSFPLSSSSVSTVLFAISFILLFCFCNVLCHYLYPPLLFLKHYLPFPLSSSSVSTMLPYLPFPLSSVVSKFSFAISFILQICFYNAICHFLYTSLLFLQCYLTFPLSSSSLSTMSFAIFFFILFCFYNVICPFFYPFFFYSIICHFLYPPLLFLQCYLHLPFLLSSSSVSTMLFVFSYLIFCLFVSCYLLFPVSSFILFLSSSNSSTLCLPFSGRPHKMTYKGWSILANKIKNQ